jgi:hypothetical protein
MKCEQQHESLAFRSSDYGSFCPLSVSCYLFWPCCRQGLCYASPRSVSSTFAPAWSFYCSCLPWPGSCCCSFSCSCLPWPGGFFLSFCSSHLCLLPWILPLSFVSILLRDSPLLLDAELMLSLFFSSERYWPSLSFSHEFFTLFGIYTV